MAKFPTYEGMVKKVAEEALDGYIYKGKTLREWVDVLAQTQWIPCSERLPEVGQRVIATVKSIDGNYVRETIYGKYGFLCGNCIAWMPLPTPPNMSEIPTGAEGSEE